MDISASEQQCLGVVCLHQMFPGLLAASNSHFCILKLILICVFHGKHCLEVRAGGCFKRLQCRVTRLERCLSDQLSPGVICRDWGVKAGSPGERGAGWISESRDVTSSGAKGGSPRRLLSFR